MNKSSDTVEFIELNNDDFYEGLVEAAKGIIVDCMQVVKTVIEINADASDGETREYKTKKLKESLEISARYSIFLNFWRSVQLPFRRAPQRLNQLISTIRCSHINSIH